MREAPAVADWHAKESHEALSLLGVSEQGLFDQDVEERRKQYGRNIFTEKKKESGFITIYKQLKSPLAIVLVVAFFLTLALQEFIDAGVIAFALSIAVIVGVLQEGKASRAFDTLASSQVKMATVHRNGGLHQIEASDLVPGDIVELSDGGQVPADMRLLKTKKLAVNEAAMTGEWLAVNKHAEIVAVGAPFAERYSMAWMGTFVSKGSGIGVVVATGDRTEVGSLAGCGRRPSYATTKRNGASVAHHASYHLGFGGADFCYWLTARADFYGYASHRHRGGGRVRTRRLAGSGNYHFGRWYGSTLEAWWSRAQLTGRRNPWLYDLCVDR